MREDVWIMGAIAKSILFSKTMTYILIDLVVMQLFNPNERIGLFLIYGCMAIFILMFLRMIISILSNLFNFPKLDKIIDKTLVGDYYGE